MKTYLEKARHAWGESIPHWVLVLAQACDSNSQSHVANEIRYSTAVVNTVLKNTYKGSLKAIEQAVEGAFLSATVECPVIGTLASNDCLENQRKPYSSTNPLRVQLFIACRSCQNNVKNDLQGEQQ
ncbi:MAG TPA: XRE family transcriptional regulator [Gammaproteobacteria bacterium]|nr:XRE family transcriptional regulator [Gammaproteobacteria bacterium]